MVCFSKNNVAFVGDVIIYPLSFAIFRHLILIFKGLTITLPFGSRQAQNRVKSNSCNTSFRLGVVRHQICALNGLHTFHIAPLFESYHDYSLAYGL